jgi:beta-galactosidase
MVQRLFCDKWKFLKTSLDANLSDIIDKKDMFKPVCIPHDWLIYDSKNLYEDSIGWYRREFELGDDFDKNQRIYLRFDGVYMDSSLYVNGEFVMDWKYGYSSFGTDITGFLHSGANEIIVKAVNHSPNSRWYSGAGIYRNVYIGVMPEYALSYDKTYVSINKKDDDFIMDIETQISCVKPIDESVNINYELYHNGSLVLQIGNQDTIELEKSDRNEFIYNAKKQAVVNNPLLWDISKPNLYKLKVTVKTPKNLSMDEDEITVGFRTMEFKPDSGFYLNGRFVKVHGVCEHHDLGCLGAAFNEAALRRKFKILKDMGVNAIRTSHNMPAKELMDIADEIGILVVSEAFDMWERPKTEYDYARFFKEWAIKDVESWICRDRNHPSLMLWSIGNEIYDTHADDHGQEITKRLVSYVRMFDPKANALITIGSNYMPWENARKCADIVKIAGYNYGEKCYEEHHKIHPDWVIYGSETGSVVQSRGVYHFPYSKGVLSDDDEQCSSLGNSTTSWGAKSTEKCIAVDRDTKFCFGQFIWTGFDYIGEPTPYHTKNSYFGQIDTAGFPKDSYYIYQAGWQDKDVSPMVHLFPYWDFNEGQLIDVRVCSNLDKVELLVNGVSYGCKLLNHEKGADFTATWQVKYEPGEIRAIAYDVDGNKKAEDIRHSFKDSYAITLTPDRPHILANGRDICFVEIGVVDNEGYPVENAMDYIEVNVDNGAYLVGMDNGDSSDYDQYKTNVRKLFNGKLVVAVQSGINPGKVIISARGNNLKEAKTELILDEAKLDEGIGNVADSIYYYRNIEDIKNIPVRKIELTSLNGNELTPENNSTVVTAKIYPQNATDKSVIFKAVNDSGIEINYVKIKRCQNSDNNNSIIVEAKGDGNFRIRAMSKSGTDNIKIISQIEFEAKGLGEAFLNPYEFITGGLYTTTIGEIGNGNEKGFATARGEERGVIFENIDFGENGSDEITLPIFALSDERYQFQIWDKDELLLDGVYQKPSIWNVYQEETYKLKRRIKGVSTLKFIFNDKVHVRGFIFKKYEKAYEKLDASSCDRIYGDSFTKSEGKITGIGNNVTIEFENMDFGKEGIKGISICGRSKLPVNTIHVHFKMESEIASEKESFQIIEFYKSEEYIKRDFDLTNIKGKCKVSFVFLPGSNFDFSYFQFY